MQIFAVIRFYTGSEALSNQHSARGAPGSSTFSPRGFWAEAIQLRGHGGNQVIGSPPPRHAKTARVEGPGSPGQRKNQIGRAFSLNSRNLVPQSHFGIFGQASILHNLTTS